MSKEQAYIPGMCNINENEVARRRKAMVVGLATAAVLFAVMTLLGLNIYLRAAVTFLPLFVGVLSYFQVRYRFCVAYAASGKQNASDDIDTIAGITEEDSRRADKLKARKIYLQTIVLSVVISLLMLLVPIV